MTQTLSIPTVAARPRRLLPATIAFAATATVLASLFLAAGAPSPLLPIYESRWGFAPWLVTLAFGVYAVALLVTLLVVGSLSDHVGRRPLLLAAVAVQAMAIAVFLVAPSIEWVLVARVLQGVSVGAGAGAFGAAIVELAPERSKRFGALFVSAAVPIGLAIGSLFAGLVAQLSSSPATTVWVVLLALAVAGVGVTLFVPESTTPMAGALASLRPRIAIPRRLQSRFAATIAVNAAAWMTGALFLGLVPTVVRDVFHLESPLIAGVGGAVAFGSGAATSLLGAKVGAHRLMIVGAAASVVGSAAFVGSVVLAAFPLVWVAAVLGGVGIGAGFSGTVRSLVPSAHPHERAGLLSGIYVVSYTALGVPAIVAGLFLASAGATAVAAVYGMVIAASAAVGIAAQAVVLTRSRSIA
ncbi:MFS transporter [Pseudolysinimonas sp.]|uniref:MFS transporter n=1 Tax=Pseudolysinimonas sp. TaxID=2680009 RepID=UPI003F7DEBCA